MLRMVLVFGSFGREQETLASLLSMCGIGVGNVLGFLVANIGAEVFVFQRCVAEPEVFFRKY